MENAKTIRDLLNAVPLSDGDFLAVNQPNVFNPITQQHGDTRKVTVKKFTDYTVGKGLNKTIDSLTEVETLSDSDVLPINQQDNETSNTGKVTIKQLMDYTATKGFNEAIDGLTAAETLSYNDELIVSQQGNGASNTRKITVKQLSDLFENDHFTNRLWNSGFNLPPRFLYASHKRRLTIKAGTILPLKVADETKYFIAADDIEININDILDDDALEAGTDYYIFLVPDDNNPAGLNIKASHTKEAPAGFTAGEVYLFGGFHSLCANVGTGLTYVEGGITKDHPLNGYIIGDILPQSVWCLNHRPHSEPEGMVYIPPLDFWCDIYLQSGSGPNTKSAFGGAITRSRQYVDFVEDQICVNKALLNDEEFAAAMMGSNEQTAVVAGEAGATTNGAGGRSDTAGRRMISIYGVEEGCGSLWQWLATTSGSGVAGTIFGQTSTTPTYSVIAITQSSYGPFGQAGGKGSFWGVCGVLMAGGHWGYGTNCGSRARRANGSRSNVASEFGGRGRSRPMRFSM